MSDELEELSPEVELAMQTALSILGGDDGDLRGSVCDPCPSEIAGSNKVEIATGEPQCRTVLRRISDRDAISISEKYVLVMWGL